MKSKNPKIQTILTKGLALILLFILMFSSLSSFQVVFAEEAGTEGESESGTSDPEDETVEDEYIYSEEIENASGEIEKNIELLQQQLNELIAGQNFTYESFKNRINKNDIIEISSEVELRALSIYVAEQSIQNTCTGKTFILKNNIALNSAEEWSPIGNYTNRFCGTFDGAGYTISGMLITVKQSFAGLIGYLGAGGTVKNLTVSESKIDMTPEVDNKINNDLILNSNGNPTVAYQYLGGIVGFANQATISNCINKSRVSGGHCVGGIVGDSWSTNIDNCKNTGDIKGFVYTGGISGYFSAREGNKSITRCYNTGKVESLIGACGGIVGSIFGISDNTASIKNSINSGEIISGLDKIDLYINGKKYTKNPENIGGIAGNLLAYDKNNGNTDKYDYDAIMGDNTYEIIIENCTNNGSVYGYRDIGGIVGQLGGAIDPDGNKYMPGKAIVRSCYNNTTDLKVTYESGLVGYIAGNISNNSKITESNTLISSTVGYIENCSYEGYNGKNNHAEQKTQRDADNKLVILGYGKAATGVTTSYVAENTEGIGYSDIQGPNATLVTISNLTNPNNKFAVVGDTVEIKITFDEKINNKAKPTLKVSGSIAKFIGIDESSNSLVFNYTIDKSEDLSRNTTESNNLIIKDCLELNQSVQDIFAKTASVTNLSELSNSDMEILQDGSTTMSLGNDIVGYSISGAKYVNGNLYFKANDKITIIATFVGNYKVEANTPYAKLNVKIGGNTISNINGIKYNNKSDKVIYEIDLADYNYSGLLTDVYLNSENSVTLVDKNNSTTNKFTGNLSSRNTLLTFSNIYVDNTAPTLRLEVSVNNKKENHKYTAGEDILIKVTTSEVIDINNSTNPEINVSFSESGLGKYNYHNSQTEAGKSNAKFIEGIENKDSDGKVVSYTYKYRYVIQPGDEGSIKFKYLSGKIEDIAGNETTLSTDIAEISKNLIADTTAPTVEISAKDVSNGITNANTIEYTFTWNEEVEGFVVEDITVNGGEIAKNEDGTAKFTKVGDTNSYTLEVIPSVVVGNMGEVQVIVEQNACIDLVGQGNVRSENILTVDKDGPTLKTYNVFINEGKTEIIVEAIFDEAIGSVVSGNNLSIKIDGKNIAGSLATPEVSGDKVIYVYNVSGADGGNVDITLIGKVKDIAGNESEELNVKIDNDIVLEKHVIESNGVEYSFSKKCSDESYFRTITDFSVPTYFKAGDKIKVIVNGTTDYEYTVVEGNNGHMKEMTVIPAQEETEGSVSFSSNSGNVDISAANIYFDTAVPTVELSATIEESVANNIYAKGKEIIIVAKTNEEITNKDQMPEINVSFSESGLGKYNYQTETGKGNAKYLETIVNEDKSISWKYKYVVTEGDEGEISLEYANTNNKVIDLAGNETSLIGYPEKSNTSISVSDLTNKDITGKETKVSYEFYNGNTKITDFTNNTYYKKGDTIKVVVKFTNGLYSSYGSTSTSVNNSTVPELKIDGKVFTTNVDNNKQITYTYTVNNDSNEKLEELELKFNTTLYAKKSDNNYETITGKTGLNILNANLYIYNNGTVFNGNDIKVDTIVPTVEISAKNADGTTIFNNVTNADTLEYIFTWTEEVVGFTVEDITVNGGEIARNADGTAKFNKVENTNSYTLEVIPAESTEKVQVIVEKNVCKDLVGYENVRSESVIRIDKIAPILIGLEAYGTSNINVENIDSVKEDYKAGDIVTIVATFSENIEGSTAPALALQFKGENAKVVNSKGEISQGNISENKITYTYKIVNGDTGTLSVKGFSGEVSDVAGNVTKVTKRNLDGDTISADTTAPELVKLTAIAPDFEYDNLLQDTDETKRYGIGKEIIIVAEYSENVYNLTSNTISGISETNAPKLKIKFGEIERTASFSRCEGKEVYYTYTIANGDNGKLSIASLDGTVSDIAGNTTQVTKRELDGDTIIADTTKATITFDSVTVVNYDDNGNVITGNGNYYRKGAVITITVSTDEYVYSRNNNNLSVITKDNAPTLNISFATNGTGVGTCTKVEYKDNKTVFTYTYTVKENDNGQLSLNVAEDVAYDIALNGNNVKSENKFIYADTVNPVTNWQSWVESEAYGIVDNLNGTWEVTFNEKLYVYDNTNYKVGSELSNSNKVKAPILLVSKDNGTALETSITNIITKTINGIEKTVITYRYADYTKNIGAYGMKFGNVSDKAGNLFNLKDQVAPILEKIEVISPVTGTYKAGEVITIVATFNEKLDVSSTAPTLSLQFSESGDAKGTVNRGVIEENKITYTYTIKEGDNGRLSAKSFTGKGLKDLSDNVWVAPETVSLSGNAITADTEPPKLVITSDVEKTNNYVVTYTFTWDEIVTDFTKEDIEIINGSKADFKQEDSEGKVYTLTVDSLEEGRQIVKVDVGVCEDIAGNLNSERATYNKVIMDYTKPIIRAKVNGGTYVIDTDSAKSILKEIIVVNEELSKFEYAWSSETDINNVKNWAEVDISEIIANSDINLESEKTSTGTYYLYIRAIDLAGNTLVTRTNGFVVLNSRISFSGIPTSVTNQDIVVTVTYGEGLTENRKAGISGKTQSADASKIIITENGTVYAESIDKAGNKVYKTFDIKNIDKVAPEATIGYTTNEDRSVTATISFNEKATITNNSGKTTYEFTENGEFTFEFKDEAGNIGTAVAKVTTIVPRDEIAPNIIFNYTLSNVTLGNPIGATIVTDEDAKISYKWDDGEWITSEEYITSINVTYEPKVDKIYTLYAKATDEAGNISDIQKLEFTVVEEIKTPEIIFEDLSTIQVDGVRYVKITDNMTKDDVTSKMNKEVLCGQTPEYTKLAEGNDLRTGSEITLNGKTKYIVVVNGDVNSDGKIDFVKDIIRANNYRLGIIKLNIPQMLAADVNGNGKIEFIQDIISINNYRLGLIKSL